MSFVLASLLSLSIELFGLAGGGGSAGGSFSGGGGGGFSGGSSYSSYGNSSNSGSASTVIIVFVFFALFLVVYIAALVKSRKHKAGLSGSAEPLQLSGETQFAKDIFIKYQHDWSAFDLASMKTYMTSHYYYHNELMMAALRLAARQNQVDNIVVSNVTLRNKDEATGNFTAGLTIGAKDITYDTRTHGVLFSTDVVTTEYYKFEKAGDSWLLGGIDEETAEESKRNTGLEQFAAKHTFCYSLDWGWLLLPAKGLLFGSGKFGTSDINNHVIGMVNGMVAQFYTYAPDPSLPTTYLIAQTAVPKTYGDIVVRRKKHFDSTPKGLTPISMEWGQFNDTYEVFASDLERVTSFELLNPTFMEQLEALPFEVNIEVADNVIYLYGIDQKTSADNYETMLTILQAAFKEMKL